MYILKISIYDVTICINYISVSLWLFASSNFYSKLMCILLHPTKMHKLKLCYPCHYLNWLEACLKVTLILCKWSHSNTHSMKSIARIQNKYFFDTIFCQICGCMNHTPILGCVLTYSDNINVGSMYAPILNTNGLLVCMNLRGWEADSKHR